MLFLDDGEDGAEGEDWPRAASTSGSFTVGEDVIIKGPSYLESPLPLRLALFCVFGLSSTSGSRDEEEEEENFQESIKSVKSSGISSTDP